MKSCTKLFFSVGITLGLLTMGPSLAVGMPVLDFHLPLPKVETLPNGLKIAWFIDERLPLVDLGMLVRTGTKNDPAGKSGTVELLSRMLERGANGLTEQAFSAKIESLGATGFSNSDEESITLGMHGLAQDANELLDVISWMALKPNFNEAEFQKEKVKVAEAWKHLPDSAESLAGYVFGKALLGGTVYGRGTLASTSELNKLKIADIREFHRTQFSPKNAILMVVGRVDPVTFRDRIIAAFGSWKGAVTRTGTFSFRDPKTSILLSKKMEIEKREVLVVDRPEVPQAQVRLGFRIPGIRSEKRYALAVANALLGEYFTSRLNLIVRDRLGLTYGIQSGLTYYKDYAFFSIASATAAQNTGQLISETVRQLRLLKAGDVLAQEIEVSKDYLLGGYPISVSTLGSVANRWLNGYSFGLSSDYLNEYMPKVSAVTRESVVNAIDDAFHLDEMVIVIAGNAKVIEASLKEKGFKRVRIIQANSLL